MRVRIRESDGVDQRSGELDGQGLRSVEQRSGGTVLRVRVVQGGASRGIEGRVEEKQRSAGGDYCSFSMHLCCRLQRLPTRPDRASPLPLQAGLCVAAFLRRTPLELRPCQWGTERQRES